MAEGNLLLSTLWYGFLYGLVLVPLGLFLGMVSCLAVGNLDTAGISVFILVLGGSLYLAYRLGHGKALAKYPKAKEAPESNDDAPMPGGQA